MLYRVLFPGSTFGFSCFPSPFFYFFFYVGHCTAACLMFELGRAACFETLPSAFWRSRDMIQRNDNRMLGRRTTTILGTTAAHQTQDVPSEDATEPRLIAH